MISNCYCNFQKTVSETFQEEIFEGFYHEVFFSVHLCAWDSASHFYPESYYEVYRAHVHHNGRVRWWFGGVMDTSCHLDGTLFPFDSQSCSVMLQSWAHSEAYVDLHNASNYVHLDGFNDDGLLNRITNNAV